MYHITSACKSRAENATNAKQFKDQQRQITKMALFPMGRRDPHFSAPQHFIFRGGDVWPFGLDAALKPF